MVKSKGHSISFHFGHFISFHNFIIISFVSRFHFNTSCRFIISFQRLISLHSMFFRYLILFHFLSLFNFIISFCFVIQLHYFTSFRYSASLFHFVSLFNFITSFHFIISFFNFIISLVSIFHFVSLFHRHSANSTVGYMRVTKRLHLGLPQLSEKDAFNFSLVPTLTATNSLRTPNSVSRHKGQLEIAKSKTVAFVSAKRCAKKKTVSPPCVMRKQCCICSDVHYLLVRKKIGGASASG